MMLFIPAQLFSDILHNFVVSLKKFLVILLNITYVVMDNILFLLVIGITYLPFFYKKTYYIHFYLYFIQKNAWNYPLSIFAYNLKAVFFRFIKNIEFDTIYKMFKSLLIQKVVTRNTYE